MTGTGLALGIDYSGALLHCAYGRGATPYTLRLKTGGDDAVKKVVTIIDQLDLLLPRIEARFAPIDHALLLIERPFLGRNPRSVISLGQTTGALIAAAYTHRWEVVLEDPADIRKPVLGVGTAKPAGEIKKIAQRWVLRAHGLAVTGDMADAIVIWTRAKQLLAGTT